MYEESLIQYECFIPLSLVWALAPFPLWYSAGLWLADPSSDPIAAFARMQGQSGGGEELMNATLPDQVVWRRIGQGDPSALALLYDRCGARLFGAALQFLPNHRDAEELLHDLFLEAWQTAGQDDREQANLGEWLLSRIEHRAQERMRTAKAAYTQAAKTGPRMDALTMIGDTTAVARDAGLAVEVQCLKASQLPAIQSGSLRGLTRRLSCLFDLDATRIHELLALAGDPAAEAWQQTELPGVRRLPFAGGTTVADADCSLIHFRPGVRLPEHRHLGDEWAIILQGSIAEVRGRQFAVGDTVFSALGSRHALKVEDKAEAVLAVATFGGIEFLR